jgi:uncharacterized protein (DUF2062 family)
LFAVALLTDMITAIQSQDSALSPVIVIPTYNNAGTLEGILRRVDVLGLAVIVVNDGSTDRTAQVLANWVAGRTGGAAIVIRHARNGGKAVALRTGFRTAIAAGHTHAVTLDSDGQLDPEQIPEFLDVARHHPSALVLGTRDILRDDYPARSRLGRRLSNFLIFLESGVHVSDSQCGLRVYPLGLIAAVPCRTSRFAFEAAIITRAGWAGCPLVEAAARCRYLPPGQRVSHFRPILDTLHGLLVHLGLLGRSLLPLRTGRRWPERAISRVGFAATIRQLIAWLHPRRLWHDLRRTGAQRGELAVGLGMGAFIGTCPIYGLQTAAALYVARRLHLHPVIVVAGSAISTPPINVALSVGGLYLGHLAIDHSLPASADFDPSRLTHAAFVSGLVVRWALGSILLGLALGVLIFLVTFGLASLFPRPKPLSAASAALRSERTLAEPH